MGGGNTFLLSVTFPSSTLNKARQGIMKVNARRGKNNKRQLIVTCASTCEYENNPGWEGGV